MFQDVLLGLIHGEGASNWAVTAYKDAQLICLDPVALRVVYCVNSVELVWKVLETFPFNNILEINRAHVAVYVKFRGPPLALDQDIFPRSSKKVARVQAKPLQNLDDLAHTVDERFVLAFPAEVLISPLESPPTVEDTLI
ncbi:hypothetical protein DSO57_1025231 [Entomophthora muscae]|uniref:Uncharacterized protein n=1 Tax=Entomophthora muscae TaxID=34485 RepID=A0ACC2TPF8_9FUNG|nr:hypothetical protein DSO57_1025231 [Entomophthora muscae]